MAIDETLLTTMGATIHSLRYADAARMLFAIMYGDRHVPEFDCVLDDIDDNIYPHLNIYMAGKDCC